MPAVTATRVTVIPAKKDRLPINVLSNEVKHGSRLGFRLRSQERFMYPERWINTSTMDGLAQI